MNKDYLILNQASGKMTIDICRELKRNGDRVVLITGSVQHADDIKTLRATKLCKENTIGRIISWIKYSHQAFWYIAKSNPVSHIIAYTNPPILPIFVWLGCLISNKTYSIIIYDIYPDILKKLGDSKKIRLISTIWIYLNRLCYRRASLIITLGQVMKQSVVNQIGDTNPAVKRIKIIPPWIDTEYILPINKNMSNFRKQYNLVDKLIVMYAGNMGTSHDISSILKSAELSRKYSDIHFVFIGGGDKWKSLKDYVNNKHMENVTILTWVSNDIFPDVIASADIALVSLDIGAEGLIFPSKTITSMAAGNAIIAISSPPNDLYSLITDAKCGLNVKPGKPDDIFSAVHTLYTDRQLLQRYQTNSRVYAEQYLDSGKLLREVLVHFNTIN